MGLLDFFSQEAGQNRRRWLDENAQGLLDAGAYMIGPDAFSRVSGLLELADMVNPVSDVGRAMQSSERMMDPTRGPWERAGAGISMLTDVASVAAPAAAGAYADDAARGLVDSLSLLTMPADDALTRFAAADDGAIRAFHGSPHDFDRFSMDKIGTGEGAQAYGHGLYFAENEAVARGYRDALAAPNSPVTTVARVKGQEVPWYDLTKDEQVLLAHLSDSGNDYAKADATLSEVFLPQAVDRRRAVLQSMRERGFEAGKPGRLYEVNINANPEDFLDWDRPLSEQPQKVREALGRFPVYAEAQARVPDGGIDLDALDGRAVLSQLEMGAGGREKLTPALREAGIPGIRYLDAGSRGAGDGSRNYVVFDENLIEIVKKYGIAGAAAMLGLSAAEVEAATQPQGLLGAQ